MKIAVCVKQVPDTNEVKINQETGTLIRKEFRALSTRMIRMPWKQPWH